MRALRVLEFIRDEEAVWNLPAPAMERLRREFPGVTFDSPRDQAAADRALPEAEQANRSRIVNFRFRNAASATTAAARYHRNLAG